MFYVYRTMWGSWLVLVALCLTGAADLGVNGQDTMGQLHWCETLCMCHDDTRAEVQCFERSDIYELLNLNRIQVMKLEKANWELENHVLWCNDTCLCHQNQDRKIFKCVEDDLLHRFISDKIGDMYFYEEGEIPSEREEEEDGEDAQNMDHRKRMEDKRKNRRNRKPKKRVKAVTTTTPTPEVIEVETTSQTEVVLSSTPEDFRHSNPTSEMRRTSGLSEHMPSSSEISDTSSVTQSTPYEDEMIEDDEGVGEYQEHEDAAEFLPKHEAVAASPAVTAMQPPTRRQPFPPTASSHAATREAETLTPKVSAVLEVPVQRKTVASEVSQDLDELGSAVMQIKSDVVLNQRILLVTVAVAGIAMLGVLVLAVHSCLASKRQSSPAQEKRPKDSSPKDDNHVTKVNLEEAW